MDIEKTYKFLHAVVTLMNAFPDCLDLFFRKTRYGIQHRIISPDHGQAFLAKRSDDLLSGLFADAGELNTGKITDDSLTFIRKRLIIGIDTELHAVAGMFRIGAVNIVELIHIHFRQTPSHGDHLFSFVIDAELGDSIKILFISEKNISKFTI